jgi:hypothetical protein
MFITIFGCLIPGLPHKVLIINLKAQSVKNVASFQFVAVSASGI